MSKAGRSLREPPGHLILPAIPRTPMPRRRTPAARRRRWWAVARRRGAPAPIPLTMEMARWRPTARHAIAPAVQPPTRTTGPIDLLDKAFLYGRRYNRTAGNRLRVGRERTRDQNGGGNQKRLHSQTSTCSMLQSCAAAPERWLNRPFIRAKGLPHYPAPSPREHGAALKQKRSGPSPALHETSKSASRRGIKKRNGLSGLIL